MGLFVGQILGDGEYKPSLWHRLFKPKTTGNSINGLGETEPRRAAIVYHRSDVKHPWSVLQFTFYIRNFFNKTERRWFLRHLNVLKKPLEPIEAKKHVAAPNQAAADVKAFALAQPRVKDVRITALNWDWVTDVITEKTHVADWPNLILIAVPMEVPELQTSPSVRAHTEVMKTYGDAEEAAANIANWIRSRGYNAKFGGGPADSAILQIPHAIAAGLGQLGKHGSLMHHDLGPCFRMTYIHTDMPLDHDGSEDIGVDDFCMSCQLCTTKCPPGAISDHKQMVRGVEKWYVDFDKCIPVFNEQHGCAICIAVCPWTKPGVANNIVSKMLRRRQKAA